MGARSIGSGTISFGLVSIPVKLFSATQSQAAISFNLLHSKCKGRLKQQYICPRDENAVVERNEMVKGYEFSKDRYVTFTPDELKELQRRREEHHLLPGRALGMIFPKPSTRTRVAFEVGIAQPGGVGLYPSANDPHLGPGRPLRDTARVLSRQLDASMLTTSSIQVAMPAWSISDWASSRGHPVARRWPTGWPTSFVAPGSPSSRATRRRSTRGCTASSWAPTPG